MTKDQYTAALRLAQSYANVNPTPESRYGLRLAELLELIEQYEQAQRRQVNYISEPDV